MTGGSLVRVRVLRLIVAAGAFSTVTIGIGARPVDATPEPPPSFITAWGTTGTGNGQFRRPTGVAVDSDGNVYVTESWNDRVQKFDSDGAFITKWGSRGSGNGQFLNPYAVAVDPTSGDVYVTDNENERVQKFDSDGTFLTTWGSRGSGNGQFAAPDGVAVGPEDPVGDHVEYARRFGGAADRPLSDGSVTMQFTGTWAGDAATVLATATRPSDDGGLVEAMVMRFTGTVDGCGTGSLIVNVLDRVDAQDAPAERSWEIIPDLGTGDLVGATGLGPTDRPRAGDPGKRRSGTLTHGPGPRRPQATSTPSRALRRPAAARSPIRPKARRSSGSATPSTPLSVRSAW
jgi:Protein of unknown function (DUF3224)/NHL repeat